jgi:hypothetical protein
VLGESDPLWVELRHMHIAAAGLYKLKADAP